MKKNILIVDDDQQIIELLKVNLENAGYQVSIAHDGEKALMKAAQEHPSLVILDLMLPGMNGYEVCEKLRMEKATQLTPILVLSAKDRPADKITGLKLGANEYLTKPFDINELVARIDGLLKHVEEVMAVNPLTKLPGNVSIMNETNKRLSGNNKFAFIYLDINNFKSYNDKYGYDKGDEVIKFTADIITSHIKENDFVGHIGGDDFILICDIADSDSIQKKIADSFDAGILKYYGKEDRQKGYIAGKDRQGKAQTFPIMTLSIGLVTNENPGMNHYGKIVEVATEMKNFAKHNNAVGKSSFAKNNRLSDGEKRPAKKILIAEDSTNLQTLLRVNLEAKGYEVLLAGDGRKALEVFYSFNPNLVILDMILPGILGIDVCQEIRKTRKEDTLPILLISGVYKKLNFRLKAKDAGATDIISKPFEIDDFTAYVDNLLSKTPAMVSVLPGAQAHQQEKPKPIYDASRTYSVEKKVIVNYPDGKVIKGTTAALNPAGPGFNMTVHGENSRMYVSYAAVSRIEVVEEF